MISRKNQLRIIKKYQNRRLYDISTSTYVVLDDIKKIIISGEEIKVIDAKTEEDITRSVLLHILLEEEMNGVPIFSNVFLFQIIKFYGKTFQPTVSPFLEQGVDLFRKTQKRFYEKIRDLYGKEKLSSGVELWREFMREQGQDIEDVLQDKLQNSTDAFLKMQDQTGSKTSPAFDYVQFSFVNDKDK